VKYLSVVGSFLKFEMKSVQHTANWLNDVLCCRTDPHNLESGKGTIAP